MRMKKSEGLKTYAVHAIGDRGEGHTFHQIQAENEALIYVMDVHAADWNLKYVDDVREETEAEAVEHYEWLEDVAGLPFESKELLQ